MAVVMTGTSYTGTHASQYWLPALFEAQTIRSGVVSVWDGIKYKVNISNMTFSGGLQPRNPTPTDPRGTITVAEKILQPESAMLYMTYNPSVLEAQWESVDLTRLMLERNLTPDFTSYVLYMVMQTTFGQNMEIGWWMSSTDFQSITDQSDSRYDLQFCDGFMKRIVNDATVLNAASPATITTSNILAAMNELLTLITTYKKALVGKYDRMKYMMSPKTADIWRQFLLSPTYKGIEYRESGQRVFGGYEIVVLNGFPDNTILFCEGTKDLMGALHIGMNSKEDENTLQIDRTRVQDETYFIKALMKFNTQIKFGNEIACWTTLTAADFTV